MKRFAFFLIALLSIGVMNADELSKKDLKQIEKDAKKEAKEKLKEGWMTLPGSLPIQRQLEESYKMRYMRENGEEMYIIREGNSVAQNYDAAKMQAIEMAKLQIANAMESEISAMMINDVNNSQLSDEDAVSITKTLTASSSKIAQNLGRLTTVMELYQKLPNKNTRVLVTLAYSAKKAREVAKKVIFEDLEKQSIDLRKTLEESLNWQK